LITKIQDQNEYYFSNVCFEICKFLDLIARQIAYLLLFDFFAFSNQILKVMKIELKNDKYWIINDEILIQNISYLMMNGFTTINICIYLTSSFFYLLRSLYYQQIIDLFRFPFTKSHFSNAYVTKLFMYLIQFFVFCT